jgi:hypothetical protein
VTKDVKICGYFAKPKGAHKQKSLGNTGIYDYMMYGILIITLHILYIYIYMCVCVCVCIYIMFSAKGLI